MKDLINKLLKTKDRFYYLAAFLLFIASYIAMDAYSKPVKETQEEALNHIDIFIPSGYQLIPILINMSENLDSMIGQYAMVHLYLQSENRTTRLVAKNIKLLRSPKNPSIFAVLVPDSYGKWFMSLKGIFTVSISNPKQNSGTEFVISRSRTSHIQYGVHDDSTNL